MGREVALNAELGFHLARGLGISTSDRRKVSHAKSRGPQINETFFGLRMKMTLYKISRIPCHFVPHFVLDALHTLMSQMICSGPHAHPWNMRPAGVLQAHPWNMRSGSELSPQPGTSIQHFHRLTHTSNACEQLMTACRQITAFADRAISASLHACTHGCLGKEVVRRLV
jgi:hypothetical protein